VSIYLELARGSHLLVVALVQEEEVQGVGHLVCQNLPAPGRKKKINTDK